MIKFSIRGENVEVTSAIRTYIEDKIGKLEKYFTDDHEMTAHVNLKTYAEKTGKVEVTIPAKNVTLRAEDTSQDLYGSVDLVQEKLERQIRKYKTKINQKRKHAPTSQNFVDEFAPLAQEDELADENVKIVRTKTVDLKPMDAEEAVLQMEVSGHDFYVFTDAETNQINIVYKREDGNVGLIETK